MFFRDTRAGAAKKFEDIQKQISSLPYSSIKVEVANVLLKYYSEKMLTDNVLTLVNNHINLVDPQNNAGIYQPLIKLSEFIKFSDQQFIDSFANYFLNNTGVKDQKLQDLMMKVLKQGEQQLAIRDDHAKKTLILLGVVSLVLAFSPSSLIRFLLCFTATFAIADQFYNNRLSKEAGEFLASTNLFSGKTTYYGIQKQKETQDSEVDSQLQTRLG